MRKQIKLIAVAATMMVATLANAQITTANDPKLNKKTAAKDVVKLIDNKGTIKYIQSMNGITQITSTAGGNKTTTTLQLGGSLEANTTIGLGTNEFILDGAKVILKQTEGLTKDESGNITDTYKFLVRDETTGQVKTLELSDLVTGGQHQYTAPDINSGATDDSVAITGLPEEPKNIFVFRNGAKLVVGTDYTVVTGGKIQLSPVGYDIYSGDIIEVQWVK